MKPSFLLAAIALLAMPLAADAAMLRKESPHEVKATLDRLEAVLKEKGLKVFARIDHAAGAASAGMELRPTELIIFGNPKAGTPLIQAEQTMGLSLPLKALAWQDADGKVWLGYDDPMDLAAQRGLDPAHPALAKTVEVLEGLTMAAVKP